MANNKTEKWYKAGTIRLVLNALKERNDKQILVHRLESNNNIDKAYITANRYRRVILKLDEYGEKEFEKEAKRLGIIWKQNGERWLENDEEMIKIVESNMIDDENGNKTIIGIHHEANNVFIKSIEDADNFKNSIEIDTIPAHTKDEIVNNNSIELMKKAVEFGITCFDAKFLNTNGIEVIKVGKKDELDVYYCNYVESFIFVNNE